MRERKELQAAMQGSEREQRQTAARHFLWRRAAVGNFNAAGRRYLPFMLPFIDEIYEEALVGAKVCTRCTLFGTLPKSRPITTFPP